MSLDKIKISNLKINKNSDGDVLHAFKKTDEVISKIGKKYQLNEYDPVKVFRKKEEEDRRKKEEGRGRKKSKRNRSYKI